MNNLELKLSVLYNRFIGGRVSEDEACEALKELEFTLAEIERLITILRVAKHEFELYY